MASKVSTKVEEPKDSPQSPKPETPPVPIESGPEEEDEEAEEEVADLGPQPEEEVEEAPVDITNVEEHDAGSYKDHIRGDSSSGSDEEHEENESEEEESEEEEEGESEEEESESEEDESGETDYDAEEAYEEELERKRLEEEEIREMKLDLIDRYILAKGLLKYERKRKAFFEDRIYRTSVRKGLIKEEAGVEDEEEQSAKDKKKSKERRRSSGRGKKKRKHSGKKHHHKRESKSERKSKDSTGEGEEQEVKKSVDEGDNIKKGKAFGEAFANKMKYEKLIRKIMKTQKQQANYLLQHQVNLQIIDEKRIEWKKINEGNMSRLMNWLKSESDHAVDSRSGKRIPHEETEQFCDEVGRIHKSLCDTMVKMFRNRRGLELSLRRLEETEIQGEGLQMLEYEQLRSENGTLKDKLEDRVKDVDNIKSKISHAIQILAHFRHKFFSTDRQIAENQEKLIVVNTDVYAARARTETIIQKYEKIRKEEQSLVVDSGLLDNAILLRDYERTHFDVMSLKEEKRNLLRQLEEGSREVQSIRDKMLRLREKYPLIFTGKAELIMEQRKAKKNRLAMFDTGTGKPWYK